MLPGPTIIRSCPKCAVPVLQHTLASGNTIGARFWTDGWREAPMLPDRPWLVKCPKCAALFWIDEASELAVLDPFGESAREDRQYESAERVRTPSAEDYNRFVPEAHGDEEKERYVRTRLWWASNDARRGKSKSAPPLTAPEKANLEVLFHLIGNGEQGDVIMKAEIARELGRFDECLTLLTAEFEPDMKPAVEMITKLAQAKKWRVAEIKPPSDKIEIFV